MSLNAQCIHTKISTTFNYQCTSGNPVGARIGIDEVIHTATGNGTVELSTNNFLLFKNGILDVDGYFEYDINDIVKISPSTSGICNISINSNEPGCKISFPSDRETCSVSMSVDWLLPVTTKLLNETTYITWSVASQINNEKYIIEHSKYGSNFSPIGEIAGDGTSNEIKHSEYIHISPSIGMNYYRIKQVDYDGKYSYSDIASVRYDGDSNINIYPNPTTSVVTISHNTPYHGFIWQTVHPPRHLRRSKQNKYSTTSIRNPYLCGRRTEI